MCGLAGFFTSEGIASGDARERLQAMASTLVHRGPDGEGVWVDRSGGLAHRRLAIIDRAGGHQPMVSPSGRVIAFNGEIYNFIEVRATLEERGHRFESSSDTEVLIHAFDEWGAECLNRLVGMFALAIWDPRDRSLFLARDRLGKKPLFIARQHGRIAFASEIKALRRLDWVERDLRPDLRALSDFLSLGYILAPKTAFDGIEKLPAAHYAVWSAERGWSVRQYWSLAEKVLAPKRPFDETAQEEFLALFDDAVRLRLRSDVPVGIHLSGGVDSSAVMASAAAMAPGDMKGFAAAFETEEFDETRFARMVAEHVGVPLEICRGNSSEKGLDKLLWVYDEPFADTSLIPSYHLNALAAPFARVVLGGDGADELFAGYPTYKADKLYRRYSRLPRPLQRLAAAAAGCIRPSYGKVSWDYKLKQFLRSHGLTPERAHYWWRVVFDEPTKKAMFTPDVWSQLEGYDPYDTFQGYFSEVKGANFLDRTLYVDIKTWLQDDILVKVDRSSMAHSVEVRSPFLDHRLVEYSFTLPEHAKMTGKDQKVILKSAMRNRLPDQILDRRKRGFNSPTRAYWRQDEDLASAAPTLFRSGFKLNEHKDDLTFRRFSLSVLATWFETATKVSGGYET